MWVFLRNVLVFELCAYFVVAFVYVPEFHRLNCKRPKVVTELKYVDVDTEVLDFQKNEGPVYDFLNQNTLLQGLKIWTSKEKQKKESFLRLEIKSVKFTAKKMFFVCFFLVSADGSLVYS